MIEATKFWNELNNLSHWDFGLESAHYRHFYVGLIRADGTAKPALEVFDPQIGIRYPRTGISRADWWPNPLGWFDRHMQALRDFGLTVTPCFTSPSCGARYRHTRPPVGVAEFAQFAREVVERYVLTERRNQAKQISSNVARTIGQ